MKKYLTKKTAFVMALMMLLFTMTGCNTKIKVTYDYNASDYVKLGDYKNITVSVDTESIENSLIEKRITSDQEENTTYTEVSRGAVAGDQVTVTFYGSVGGEQVDSFSNEDTTYTLGTDTFVIPGFMDALYGMTAGETKVVTLTVPEDFTDDASYAGKRIVYDITMTTVEQPNVPMITDAYAQEYFSVSTVAEYRESIKSELQSTIDEEIESAKKEAVLKELQEECEITGYPEDYLAQKTEDYNTSISFYCTMQGKSVDEYCQDTYGLTFDEYVKKAVAQEMILQAIAVQENLTMTEYEYKGDLESFASDMGYTEKTTFVEKYGKEKIVKSMIMNKAQQIVMDNAIYE